MAVRADWSGLDDISDRIGDATQVRDDDAAVLPRPVRATPAVLIVPVDDSVPFVSAGGDLRSHDEDAFVPPGGLHAIPALVHIPPAAQDFGLSDEVAFISGVYPDGTQPLYAF